MCQSPILIRYINPDHIAYNLGKDGKPIHDRYIPHYKDGKKFYERKTEYQEYRPAHLHDYEFGANTTLGFYGDCGKCPECVAKKVRQFGMRLQHEFQYLNEGYYITLTYSQEHLPHFPEINFNPYTYPIKFLKKDHSHPILNKINQLYKQFDNCNNPDISYEIQKSIYHLEQISRHPTCIDGVSTGVLCGRDVSLYHHRLRKFLSRWYDINDLKFFTVGEYGGKFLRPHIHEIIGFTSTEKSRHGYHKVYSNRGKKSFMDYIIKCTGKVPPLTSSVFHDVVLHVWGKCEPQAFDCQSLRSPAAASNYISKYLSKMFFGDKKPNVCLANQLVPMFKRVSLGIGKRWLIDHAETFIKESSRPYVEEHYQNKYGGHCVKYTWLPKYYILLLDTQFGFHFSQSDYIIARSNITKETHTQQQYRFENIQNNHMFNILNTSRNERE